MHLVDYLSVRAVPAAGVALALTRRCPLSCAHCSTSSTLASEEAPAATLRRFVATFTPDDRPDLLAISGGEAFLRPRLLRELAELAAESGCRSSALSGMFWAKARRIPAPIRAALDALDHFSVSLDVFHEREVDRRDVYRVLDTLLSEGRDVSVHLVGLGPDDPYLAERTAEIRGLFDDRVPMLVNAVGFQGRAREWLERANGPARDVLDAEADPCGLAAWPLVGWDGTIVACANDDVVESPPPHLLLGHAATDAWAEIRERCLVSPMVRAIRTYGPEVVAARHGSPGLACGGYCSTCMALPSHPGIEERVAAAMATPAAVFVERQVAAMQRAAGAPAFARRFAMPAYAELVTLGAPGLVGAAA